jgi:hypothetical protein
VVVLKIIKIIRDWNEKPKKLVEFLSESIINDNKLFSQLIEILKNGSDVEKGTVADVMKHVSKSKPEIVLPYVDFLMGYINYKASRVKWGIPETIGNLAKSYPKEAQKAIPNLLVNTQDKSTVVRWCAAYALSEIAINDTQVRQILVPKIKEIIQKEKNNGVKNIYIKALKIINK